jgi:membrane fusion protein (multidrug efflux system)
MRGNAVSLSAVFPRAALLSVAALLAAFLLTPPARGQSPVLVGTVAAERRPVTEASSFVGRLEATQRVEIRAPVTGFLEAVLFKEGEVVAEGAPLFQIEPGPYEAAVRQA